MLRLEKASKSFGGQVLFEEVDWFLGDRDRVGLIGRNGTGKSTLLRMLARIESPDAGALHAPRLQSVGLLPQFGFESGPGTVSEESRRVFDDLLSLRAERERIEARLAGDDLDPAEAESLLARHTDLEERFGNAGGYEIERRVHQVLTGLGFSEADFGRPVRSLSGGWQMRVALARLLLQNNSVLLLDEPTNHLDIEARVWLEGFLAESPNALVIVSHDRHFLDRTVGRVTEIMGRKLIDYAGNYSSYVEQRQVRYEMALKAYERQQEEIARITRFIDRFRAKNTKAPQVQSRIRMLEKMERLEPPNPPSRAIRFRFPQPESSGRIVMRLRDVAKRYGDLAVFRGADLDLERGEKIALVGPNGAGKSTLMRILAGEEDLQQGSREVGFRVLIESFAQDQADRLPEDRTLLAEATDRAPVALVPAVRNLLGAFLFRGDDVDKPLRVLSGGERNRFALMLMLLRPANLLLLDEPTNHLDIEAQEVLLAALNDFTGTVVFVSHDHHFIERLATRIVEVGGGSLRSFPGDYESYLWRKKQEEEQSGPGIAVDGGQEPEDAPSREDRRGEKRVEPRRGRMIVRIEDEIASLEERKAKLEDLMGLEGFFRDPDRSRFYIEEHRNLLSDLERLYKEWHDLAEE
ncbi:MAG: ABC-F family ATP-binding cassette domain-containing protein [Candidatus Eisenbacteria bacterium]|nr:ABC-F family ATP-binding cassette domain-containing protein [Candidatus Eisenbacteria bacterium]